MLLIDPQVIILKIINFLRLELEKAGFAKVILGLSGGVDSSTAAYLAVKALGPENVLIVLLPCGNLNKDGLLNAQKVIKNLAIPTKNVFLIDIEPIFKEISEKTQATDKVREGNVMARIRMILLYDLAKKEKALVLGTENRSESLLGYFTRFGDAASDVEILSSFYKTQVYQLAKYLGVSREIINTPPTAGLWSGQTDEGEFGFSYADADKVLYWYERGLVKEEIIEKGIKKEVVTKVLTRVEKMKFKHQVPRVFSLEK